MEKLNEKQKRFVDFYIQTGNASEAARLADYKGKNLNRIVGEISEVETEVKVDAAQILNKKK